MIAQLRLPRSQITQDARDRDSFGKLCRHARWMRSSPPIDEQPDPSSPAFRAAQRHQNRRTTASMSLGRSISRVTIWSMTSLPSIADVAPGPHPRMAAHLRGLCTERAHSCRRRPGQAKPRAAKFELQQQRPLALPTGGRIGDYDESRWRTLRDILLFAKLGKEDVPLGSDGQLPIPSGCVPPFTRPHGSGRLERRKNRTKKPHLRAISPKKPRGRAWQRLLFWPAALVNFSSLFGLAASGVRDRDAVSDWGCWRARPGWHPQGRGAFRDV